ncbi:hypothetical protein PhaeoP30_01672 [Phaeobacter inhibens]|nr:hypothetical protein PhaeoP30_01672 [Phaeobacter inhibens]AUQ62678.1 hypothetical protein PhaeoP51_01689 [Phaeobacter inhibens]AUQ82581.1 hypothetical protein PhaeoP57_01649 [Phaeobacter inhibens]AUQ90342.1 hypothetical protein PhaeoP24_01723 [Phaeobacter inhibens]
MTAVPAAMISFKVRYFNLEINTDFGLGFFKGSIKRSLDIV